MSDVAKKVVGLLAACLLQSAFATTADVFFRVRCQNRSPVL